MKLCSILILLILCAAQVQAATYGVTVPAQNTLTNGMLPYATSGRQLASTAIQQSGLTNLLVPGYIALGNTTNRISDDGTNLTRNGTAIGTGGGSALWTNIAGILSPYPTVAEVDIVNDASVGDPATATFYTAAFDNVAFPVNSSYLFFSGSSVTGEGDFVLSGTSGTDFTSFAITTYPTTSSIFLDSNLGTHLSITPMIASGVMASINSAFSLTNNDTLFEARNFGSQRFRIDANSGYTGAGTLFLSDDGTYKSAGGGGDTIWTNVSGTIQPLSGQTTNRLSFTSGAADNATNIAFRAGSENVWNADGALLGAFHHAGTNVAGFQTPFGQLRLGPSSFSDVSEGSILSAVYDASLGHPSTMSVGFVAQSDPGFTTYSEVFFGLNTSGAGGSIIGDATDSMGRYGYLNLNWNPANPGISIQDESATRLSFEPRTSSSGSAVAHFLDTSNVLTNGDSLFQVRNTGVTHFRVAGNSGYGGGGTKFLSDDGTYKQSDARILACSDLTTSITVSTNKAYFYAPYALTVTRVKATLNIAQASGSIFTVDINEEGTSILSTKLTVDNTENTSDTAAAAPVISDASIANNARVSIDVDQIGNGTAAGLIVEVYFNRQ